MKTVTIILGILAVGTVICGVIYYKKHKKDNQ